LRTGDEMSEQKWYAAGPRAKRDPEWVDCGGDMVSHVRAPNMRLKLIGGRWMSVKGPYAEKSETKKKKDLTIVV
jgi:uncharacterized membrane-anchored protein